MCYCFRLHLFPRPNECQQNALHHHPPTKQQNSWFRGAFMSTYSEVCYEDSENISPEKLWDSQPLSLALKTSANSGILVWISRPSSTEIPSTNHNSMQLYWALAELYHQLTQGKKRVPIAYDSSDWREFQANHKITNIIQRWHEWIKPNYNIKEKFTKTLSKT